MIRIMLVDDEVDLLELCSYMLEIAGYSVITAADGEEAIQKFASLDPKPDVIIMDYRMPRKNGIEAAEEILSHHKPHIIFASADDSIIPKIKQMNLEFIKKPFSVKALTEDIEKVLHTATA